MRVSNALDIDEAELDERFVRASGPGGQNVNKVSTAVELRFDLQANTSIPDYARERLKRLAGRFRSQEQNRADARARLIELIEKALVRQKLRIKTKPSRGAREERIKAKAVRGRVKKMRSRKVDLD